MANAPRPPKLKDVLLNDIGNVQRPLPRPAGVVRISDKLFKDIGAIQRPSDRKPQIAPFRPLPR